MAIVGYKLWLGLLLVWVLGGCASVYKPQNVPLDKVEPNAGFGIPNRLRIIGPGDRGRLEERIRPGIPDRRGSDGDRRGPGIKSLSW